MEQLIGVLLRRIADAAAAGAPQRIGLDPQDPLVLFFSPGGESLDTYLALDDTTVWAAAARMAKGPDEETREYALQLLERRPFRALDVQAAFPQAPNEPLEDAEKRWQREIERIDGLFAEELGTTVFKDLAPISIYSEIGTDLAKAQKCLMVLVDGSPHEITQISETIRTLQPKRNLVRYYFRDESMRRRAREERS
jgi:hypothetical protein